MSKKVDSAILLILLLTTVLSISSVQIHEARAGGFFPEPDWSKMYGGPSFEDAYSVVQTDDSGYALGGRSNSYGAGLADFWLVKTNSSGGAEWNKTYGGSGYEVAFSLIQTGSDEAYVMAGRTNSFGSGGHDIWLVKTDSAGNHVWNRTYGGPYDDEGYSVIRTTDGGYAIAGYTSSFGSGQRDFWLVKTDSNGNMLWNKTYGGIYNEEAHSVVQTIDGGYALAGFTGSFGAGSLDCWLVRTDSHGNLQWSQTYGGASSDGARSMVLLDDGGYALAGFTASYGAGSFDFWLIRTNSSGNALWNSTYGGVSSDQAYSLVETVEGGFALAGYFGNDDILFVKTDSDGNMQLSKTYGGTNIDKAYSLVQTNDYGYAIAGSSDFPLGAGETDMWLIKLTPRTIRILSDGSVDPSNAPIQRNGDLYTLTDDVFVAAPVGIVVERNNIILDGAGYTLQGAGGGNGLHLFHSGGGRVNVTVTGIQISGCFCGIYAYDAFNITISESNMTNNSRGIYLYGSTNVTIVGNVLANNTLFYGILSASSNYTTIARNIIANNGYGICNFQSSSYNTIVENTIADNAEGIYLENSSGNTICHNNFLDNSAQAVNYNSVNTWDDGYPSGGNYWSNYAGADVYRGPDQAQLGSDAIGDDPYIIDQNNQDNYPLMGSFGTTTEEGDDVAVFPAKEAALVFKKITKKGHTRAKKFGSSPLPPPGRALVGPYYDIKTTAYYSDTIMIRIIYDDTGLTPEQEDSLQLTHWLLFGDVTGETQNPYEFISDGKVDIKDIAMIAKYFGKDVPPAPPECDISSSVVGMPDGKIDIKDIALAAKNFGELALPTNITTYVDKESNLVIGETDHLSIMGVTIEL